MTNHGPKLDRRLVVGAIAALPAVAGFTRSALAQPVCYDPATLTEAQKSKRTSLSFEIKAADPGRECKRCAFYTAGADDCGNCRLLAGPVFPDSSCRSFVASGR